MAAEENKATVRRFNMEFIQDGSMETFNQIIDPAFVNHTAPPGTQTGPDGVYYFFNHMLKPAFSGFAVEIHEQFADGDTVTTRKSFHGTHTGEFFGAPASGKPVRIDVIDIVKLRDGKFTDHWGIVDWSAVMAQINGQ